MTCSSTGKLTTQLYKQYSEMVVKEQPFLLILDSWGGQVNPSQYDKMFTNEDEVKCNLKVIPPECTGLCQTYDVYFFTQAKNFVKCLQNNVFLMQTGRHYFRGECTQNSLHHSFSIMYPFIQSYVTIYLVCIKINTLNNRSFS